MVSTLSKSALFVLVVLGLGCKVKEMSLNQPPKDDSSQAPINYLDINRYPLDKVVCDPLKGSSNPKAPAPRQGLSGNLYWIPSNQPSRHLVKDFITYGTKSDKQIFFSKLDIPTRMFDKGFPTETGALLKNDLGDVLYENFALELNTTLQLAPSDLAGNYEIAALGDDGITVHTVDASGNESLLINADGLHPTQMGCANQVLAMNPSTKVNLRIRYAQGPRYHIAFMLIWRKVSSGTPAEHRCGWTGNYTFFNPDQNSAPSSEYLGMQASGWKVIQPENLSIPQEASFNPCSGSEVPSISDLYVKVQSNGRVHVSWKTEKGAASQVLYKNLNTGVEVLTLGNTKVQKNHQFEIGNLDPNANYSFKAVSFSEEYGKTISEPVIVRPIK